MKLVNNEIMINYLTLILSILIINNCLTLIKAANIQIFFYSTINKEKIFANKTIFQFGNEAIFQFGNEAIYQFTNETMCQFANLLKTELECKDTTFGRGLSRIF